MAVADDKGELAKMLKENINSVYTSLSRGSKGYLVG